MRPVNIERNQQLYELWQRNHTIEEAHLKTNIPRSTVGYYYKKFKSHSAKGIDLGRFKRKRLTEILESRINMAGIVFNKVKTTMRMMDIIERASESKDFSAAYYELSVLKLLLELMNKIKLTPEEESYFQSNKHNPNIRLECMNCGEYVSWQETFSSRGSDCPHCGKPFWLTSYNILR